MGTVNLTNQTDQEFLGDNSTTEFNMSHSVDSGSNRALLVLVSWLNDVPEIISSIRWDPEGANELLIKIDDYTTDDDSRVEAWQYFLPPHFPVLLLWLPLIHLLT